MSNAQSVFATLAQQEQQQNVHTQNAAQANANNAESVFSQLAANNGETTAQAQQRPTPTGDFRKDLEGATVTGTPSSETPMFGYQSQTPGERLTMPLAKALMTAHEKLKDVENMTSEEGKRHPIQEKIGQVANAIEGFLWGNPEHQESAIGTGKYGMATNPALAATTLPEAGEGVINAVREVNAARGAGQAAEEGPGLVKQVLKGKEVAQEPAKKALATASGSKEPNLRAMMDKPIAESAKAERSAYDTVNKAAGTDLKDLYDYRSKLEDAIDNPSNIDREDLLRDKLKDVEARIGHAESDATKNLVNAPEELKNAKGLTQKRYAQEELKKRLFNNEGVVSGNAEHGAEESINLDSAIREIEKLDKPSRYAPEGSPTRLEQALGKDGAKELKQALYDAQKAGEKALSRQKMAKMISKGVGLGLAGTGIGGAVIRHALGTTQ